MRAGDDTDDSPYYVSWKEKVKYGKEKQKKENVHLFENSKRVRVLNTARSLDEAADIDNVDVAIILSYSSTARQLIQRIGRVIRFAEGKVAHIFVLCLTQSEGTTQEEKWLREALIEMDEYRKIKVRFIDKIEYEGQEDEAA